MARKVYIDIKVRAIISIDEDMEVSEVMDDIELNFNDGDGYEIEDTALENYTVTDSK